MEMNNAPLAQPYKPSPVTQMLWKIYAYFYDVLFELLPYQRLMDTITSSIPDNKETTKLLDAGCGTANFEMHLLNQGKQHGFDIDAIDSSSAMLSKSQKKLAKQKWVSFNEVDMNQALPFENNYFDHIVSINSIYATQNPKAVLKEFYRKLKSGGSLYLVNPVKKPSISAVLSEHITLISEHKGFAKNALILRNILKFPQFVLVMIVNLMILKLSKNSVFHFYDIGEFEALVEECGFKLSHTQTIYGDTDIFIIAKKKL